MKPLEDDHDCDPLRPCQSCFQDALQYRGAETLEELINQVEPMFDAGPAPQQKPGRTNPFPQHRCKDAEYERRLAEQDSTCAICLVQFPRSIEVKTKKGKTTRRALSVDHCHETGKTRGLLCPSCNFGLGAMADDPDRLRRAAHYLQAGPLAVLSAWRKL